MTVNPHHAQTYGYNARNGKGERAQGAASPSKPSNDASPPAKRHKTATWAQPRFILGLVLVAVSVFLGARVVASANDTVDVWVTQTPLSANTVLSPSDVTTMTVQLFDAAQRYIPASEDLIGKSVLRDLGEGEFVPRDALQASRCGSLLTIPVSPQNLPGSLVKGARIDLFSTPDDGSTTQVLNGAVVQGVDKPSAELLAPSTEWIVSVRVHPSVANTVIHAVNTTQVDIAIVDVEGINSDPCHQPASNS